MAGGVGKKANAAKKAGAVKKTGVTIPPTKRRSTLDKESSFRNNAVTNLINMRRQKVKRDTNTGDIVKGSVLEVKDRHKRGETVRIAGSRGYFGDSHVIGQDAMAKFREEMTKRLKDPYSVLIKPAKLPLSLLEEPKVKESQLLNKAFNFKGTFGKGARRKRVELSSATLQELHKKMEERNETYSEGKDRNLLKNIEREMDPTTATGQIARDMTIDRNPYAKGQSSRIWGQLWKVIDSADVILQVLDARDPMGTRSMYLENYLQKEKKFKHLIFVLNKVDLVPTWVTARWLQILSKDRPTIAFHASMENPFGKGNLINLLRQFSRLHGAVKGKKGGKKTISVGLIGYPNVGKSSVINTIRAKKVCKVAPLPGETKVWQYVNLSKSIFMIDCPGVIHDSDHKNNDVEAVLKGVVRIERMGQADKDEVVKTVLDIIKKDDLKKTYEVDWENSEEFLTAIAVKRGKLLRGGEPDLDSSARMVLHDWVRGKLPWFNAPPFESNQQYRDHQMEEESTLLKKIQNYSTFNIVNEELKSKVQQDEEGITAGSDDEEDEEDGADAISDPEDGAASVSDGGSDDDDEEEEEEEEDEQPQKPRRKGESAVTPGAPATWASFSTTPKPKQQRKPVAAPAPASGLSPWEALKAAASASKAAAAAASTTKVGGEKRKAPSADAPAPEAAAAAAAPVAKKVRLVKKKRT